MNHSDSPPGSKTQRTGRFPLEKVLIGVGIVVALCVGITMIPLIVDLIDGPSARAGCEDWNRYITEVNSYSSTLNDRLEILRNPSGLTPGRIQVIIEAFENDIENWRASDPPAKASALNSQLIAVLEGWIDVFSALREGTYTDQMLFDLQREDDELERLTRVANSDCVD